MRKYPLIGLTLHVSLKTLRLPETRRASWVASLRNGYMGSVWSRSMR